MVTLHEPDFRSLEVTVLQTADRGIILLISCPHYIQRPTNCQLAIWCSSTESNCRLILTMDSLYHLTTRALVPRLGVEPRTLFLLREATLPDLSSGAIWSEWQESNLHYEVPNLGDYHYHTLSNNLVPRDGIEPPTPCASNRCSTI